MIHRCRKCNRGQRFTWWICCPWCDATGWNGGDELNVCGLCGGSGSVAKSALAKAMGITKPGWARMRARARRGDNIVKVWIGEDDL